MNIKKNIFQSPRFSQLSTSLTDLKTMKFHVITVSDSCYEKKAEDKSGPIAIKLLADHFQKIGKNITPYRPEPLVLPDTMEVIAEHVRLLCDAPNGDKINLLITVGGTGFGVRDTTPEAVRPLLIKEASGLVHAMLSYSLANGTPYAWLSRPVAGVRNGTLVITLPGSSKAVSECLAPLITYGLDHALELLAGDTSRTHPTGETAATPNPTQLPVRSHCSQLLPVNVTERPRVSAYPMVPMPEALETIERICRTHARVGTTAVVGKGSNTKASSMNGPYSSAPIKTYSDPVEAAIAVEGTAIVTPVISSLDLPPFRASIKDGYAVVSVDGPGEYPVIATATAGATYAPHFLLSSGHVCRVSTGGPVPDGADAVVQVEDTSIVSTTDDGKEERIIAIKKPVAPNHDIRPVGCDILQGQEVLAVGAKMGPAEIALWHTVGQPPITHFQKPVVAVLSTGNELSDATPLPPGTIYDSNKGMLMSALRQTSGGGGTQIVLRSVDGGIVNDEFNPTREGIIRAFREKGADVLISTGGVSMGEADHIKAALLSLGATIHFGRVNMKPGKPTTFASIPSRNIFGESSTAANQPDKLFFGLPGNPVSAMVCYHVFVVPALRVLCGLSSKLPTISAQLSHPLNLDRERPEYHRCILSKSGGSNGNPTHIVATSTGPQASHRLLSMHGANGLLVLPTGDDANQSRLQTGAYLEAIIIGDIV